MPAGAAMAGGGWGGGTHPPETKPGHPNQAPHIAPTIAGAGGGGREGEKSFFQMEGALLKKINKKINKKLKKKNKKREISCHGP